MLISQIPHGCTSGCFSCESDILGEYLVDISLQWDILKKQNKFYGKNLSLHLTLFNKDSYYLYFPGMY